MRSQNVSIPTSTTKHFRGSCTDCMTSRYMQNGFRRMFMTWARRQQEIKLTGSRVSSPEAPFFSCTPRLRTASSSQTTVRKSLRLPHFALLAGYLRHPAMLYCSLQLAKGSRSAAAQTWVITAPSAQGVENYSLQHRNAVSSTEIRGIQSYFRVWLSAVRRLPNLGVTLLCLTKPESNYAKVQMSTSLESLKAGNVTSRWKLLPARQPRQISKTAQ